MGSVLSGLLEDAGADIRPAEGNNELALNVAVAMAEIIAHFLRQFPCIFPPVRHNGHLRHFVCQETNARFAAVMPGSSTDIIAGRVRLYGNTKENGQSKAEGGRGVYGRSIC